MNADEAERDSTAKYEPTEIVVDPSDDDITIRVVGLPPGTGVLIVTRGPNIGSRFVLDRDETLIGRHPKADIFLDDISVSRRHAVIERRSPGDYVLRDEGSLNGTYVNRELKDQVELESGSEVQVGRFRMVFAISEESGTSK